MGHNSAIIKLCLLSYIAYLVLNAINLPTSDSFVAGH